MSHETYIFCVAMFILGQAADLFLFKIPDLRKTSRALNKTFYLKQWWNCDWNIIIGTQVIGALCIFGIDELVHWKPGILEYVKWFFAAVGAFGSEIAMTKGSQFKKQLTALTDVKASVSDAVTGGTETVHETIEKGEQATGIEIKPTA